jgi:hypothetical protein
MSATVINLVIKNEVPGEFVLSDHILGTDPYILIDMHPDLETRSMTYNVEVGGGLGLAPDMTDVADVLSALSEELRNVELPERV